MMVLMTMAGFVGNMFTIGDVSSQISEVEKSIAKTDISLDALEALTGSAKVNFTLNNDDTEKLWNFENFNVLIEYDNAVGTVVFVVVVLFGYVCLHHPVIPYIICYVHLTVFVVVVVLFSFVVFIILLSL